MPELSIGNRYTREDVGDIFDTGFGNINPGINRRRADDDSLYGILFSTASGKYADEVSDAGRFSYMGEGDGDQQFREEFAQCGNCFLRDAIGEEYPLYFFHRETTDEDFEYRGRVACKGYEWVTVDGDEKISFALEYQEYPEGLPSPTPQRVRAFVEQKEAAVRTDVSEAELRERVLDSFVYDVLEWPRRLVEEEYGVKSGAGYVYADYVLLVGGEPRAVVEAKRPSSSLGDEHARQLASYMQLSGAPFGLLTNGREFRLYLEDEASEALEKTAIFEAEWDSLDEVELWPLVHASTLREPAAAEMAREIGRKQRVVNELRANHDAYLNDIVDVLPADARDTGADVFEDALDDLIEQLEDETPVIGRPELHTEE